MTDPSVEPVETLPADRAPAVDPASIRRWGAWYVTEHLLLVMKNYGGVVIATAIGTPLIYLFAFGVGLASLVSESTGGIDGVSYLVFVAPALICMAAVTVASSEFTYPIMLGFKWNPFFVGMNAAPLSARQIMDGQVLFVAIRMTITALFYWVVMLAFGALPSAAGIGTVPVAVLCGLALGTPVLAYSASITEDKGQFPVLLRVIILPLSLFSGTIFPLAQLPVYLQWIGWLSPLWHGTELARRFAYGGEEPLWLTLVHVVFLVVVAIVGWQIAVRVATRRLDK